MFRLSSVVIGVVVLLVLCVLAYVFRLRVKEYVYKVYGWLLSGKKKIAASFQPQSLEDAVVQEHVSFLKDIEALCKRHPKYASEVMRAAMGHSDPHTTKEYYVNMDDLPTC